MEAPQLHAPREAEQHGGIAGEVWLETVVLKANPGTYEWFDIGQVSPPLSFLICKKGIITCSFQTTGRMKQDVYVSTSGTW